MTAGSGGSLFWLMKIKNTEVKKKTILNEKEIKWTEGMKPFSIFFGLMSKTESQIQLQKY